MAKPKVLVIGDLNTALPEYREFQTKFDTIRYEVPLSKEQLISDFSTKFTDINAIYGAWLGFVLLGGFKDEILAAAPASLKVISICSVGHDHYDGKAMAERGIILTNVPSDGAAEPVADLVLFNTLAAFRNFKIHEQNFGLGVNHTVKVRKMLDSESFDAKAGKPVLTTTEGYSFGEKVAGRQCLSPRNHHAVIVGFGNIGQTIARRLANIGMHIHYVKRSKLVLEEEQALEFPVTYHSCIEDTAEFADLVVVACPGTKETYHLISAAVLAKFAKRIRIINIGRGPVIDEEALVAALELGKVVFAGLDVFENEPAVHPKLYGRQDVILTPHIGASTVENFDFTAVSAMKNIENVLLEGGNGIHRVN